MRENFYIEDMLEKLTIVSLENDTVSVKDVNNDFITIFGTIIKDNQVYNLSDLEFKKEKVGIKVALLKVGILFKEIIINNSFGLKTAIIYNDYLNIYYSGVNYTEDLALLLAYKKAMYDIVQFNICGLNFSEKEEEYNSPIIKISEGEQFNNNDYIFNKFCQDVDSGLIKNEINIKEISEEHINEFLDYEKSDKINLKFYLINLSEQSNFIYGQLYNSKNQLISENCYFNNNFSEALCKTYIKLIDSAIDRCLKNQNLSWLDKIDYTNLYYLCNEKFLDQSITQNIKINSNNIRESEKKTNLIQDFYKFDEIKVSEKSLYVNDICIVNTGINCRQIKEFSLNYLKKLLDEDDMYLKCLLDYILKKVKF